MLGYSFDTCFIYLRLGFEFQSSQFTLLSSLIVNNYTLSLIKIQEQSLSMHLFSSYSYICSIKEGEHRKRKGIQLLNLAHSASVKENKEILVVIIKVQSISGCVLAPALVGALNLVKYAEREGMFCSHCQELYFSDDYLN